MSLVGCHKFNVLGNDLQEVKGLTVKEGAKGFFSHQRTKAYTQLH